MNSVNSYYRKLMSKVRSRVVLWHVLSSFFFLFFFPSVQFLKSAEEISTQGKARIWKQTIQKYLEMMSVGFFLLC